MTSIPMSSPDIGPAEIEAVTEVLRRGQVSSGAALPLFEAAFADYVGRRFAAAVSSGTSGLHLCMIAAGVGRGDFVITSPSSFVASANCIVYQGAVPVFVDVDPVSGNIDPSLAAQAAHDLVGGGKPAAAWLPRRCETGGGGKLRAILPVHALGRPAEMNTLLKASQRCGAALVEDSCEALGTTCATRPAGCWGDASVFGFYANKPLTTGEGGMVLTDREDWALLFRSLRNQGRDASDGRLQHHRLGFNYRMDNLSAALGLAQLGRIEELLQRRAEVAGWYDGLLSGLDWVERPEQALADARPSWFAYVIRIRPPFKRDRVAGALARRGIPTRVYFPPIHLQRPYRHAFGYRKGDFPNAERIGDTSLALPFSGIMSRNQVESVCQALRQAEDSFRS